MQPSMIDPANRIDLKYELNKSSNGVVDLSKYKKSIKIKTDIIVHTS